MHSLLSSLVEQSSIDEYTYKKHAKCYYRFNEIGFIEKKLNALITKYNVKEKNYENLTQLLVRLFKNKKVKLFNVDTLDYEVKEAALDAKGYRALWYLKNDKVFVFAKEISDKNEAEMHKKVLHPNISTIYKYFKNNKEEFEMKNPDNVKQKIPKTLILMPVYPLGTLMTFINKKLKEKSTGPLDMRFTQFVAAQVLMALDYLDSIKLAHCDVKVSEVFNL